MKKGERAKEDLVKTSSGLQGRISCLQVKGFLSHPTSACLGFTVNAKAGLGTQEAARYTSS